MTLSATPKLKLCLGCYWLGKGAANAVLPTSVIQPHGCGYSIFLLGTSKGQWWQGASWIWAPGLRSSES